MKPQRVEAANVFKPSNPKFFGNREHCVADIRKALTPRRYSYTQGYMPCARRSDPGERTATQPAFGFLFWFAR